MESTTVEPEKIEDIEEVDIPEPLLEAIKKEMDYLKNRGLKLVRLRTRENSDKVYQSTIYAGDEMYRLTEVQPGQISKTIFRNPEPLEITTEEKTETATTGEEIQEDIPDEEKEKTYQVELVKEGAKIEVQGDQYILDAAEEQGFDLPYSCREGECLSCSALIEEGNVDQPRANAIDKEEKQKGYALTCIAMPRSNLKVRTNEKP